MRADAERALRRAHTFLERATVILAESGNTAAERRAGDHARLALRIAAEALGVKVCEWCGKEYPAAGRRRDARFCCHQHAVNASTARARAREGGEDEPA